MKITDEELTRLRMKASGLDTLRNPTDRELRDQKKADRAIRQAMKPEDISRGGKKCDPAVCRNQEETTDE